MWFTNVIKPTHRCNLSCVYCYNEDIRRPVMSYNTLHRVIDDTFAYAASLGDTTPVDFIWHGGEPLLAGLDFYRTAVGLQSKFSRDLRYSNSVQTNGTLIDEKWIEFFHEHCFDVSLSLDGPCAINDLTRHYSNGKGSFDNIMHGIRLLRDAKLPHGVCVVISKLNIEKVEDIFKFLSNERLPFNVIPLTRSGGASENFHELGLEPHEYAEPWTKMFDLWFDAGDKQYVQCTDFIRKARSIIIGRPTDCIGQKQCATHHISTDHDGLVYPCATLSGDNMWAYGDIKTSNLDNLMTSSNAKAAANRMQDPHCECCKWWQVCHGGCMARSLKFHGTYNRRDYYCPSLQKIYSHIEKRLRSAPDIDLSLSALPKPGSCRWTTYPVA